MRVVCLLATYLTLLSAPLWAAELHVSPTGDDTGPGTADRPLKTLGRAAELLQPGDTAWVHAGTYRETVRPARSGEAGRPIRFMAAPGEKVIVSGADVLAGPWTVYQGNIWRTPTDKRFVQLFVDGKMMIEARWPNTRLGDLMVMNRASAEEGTDYDVIADPNLPPGDWTGAVLLIWPGDRWTNATRRVTEYEAGKALRVDLDFRRPNPDPYHVHDPYKPRAGNPYVLIGSLAGLDMAGEWALDEKTGTAYLWTPDSTSPVAHMVEVKQRALAFDLSKLSNIQVQGFDIFAAAVSLADAHGCLVEDCRMRYVDHFRDLNGSSTPAPANVMTGADNELRRCLIAYSAGTALAVAGENNRLTNCVVHDANYLGTGRGGLDLSRSVGARISHCSVFRAGRDIIQHGGSKRICIEYCDLYNANMLNNDAGAIYCWGTKGEGGVIAYNWIHDNLGDGTSGVYLDNFSSDFFVHHNVIWNCSSSAIHLNSDALNHTVCNNTIAHSSQPFGTFTYARYTPTMKGTRILNNLVNAQLRVKDPTVFVQGELGPELSHNGQAAVDRDGYPTADSAAIDAGLEVPGITDGFLGKAPDLGAYEFGGPRWVPGADWRDPEAPPEPSHDLSYTPLGRITEQTMMRDGLALWLDASDRSTFSFDAQGGIVAWRDRSDAHTATRLSSPDIPLRLVRNGLNGKPVVRGEGKGGLRIAPIRREPGPATVLVVSAAAEATGNNWQRIMACYTGKGDEWVLPNWILLRPSTAGKPEAYAPQVFTIQRPNGMALDRMTVLGATASEGQYLAGDVAEVLVFTRMLRFDEQEAIEAYLHDKWGLDGG